MPDNEAARAYWSWVANQINHAQAQRQPLLQDQRQGTLPLANDNTEAQRERQRPPRMTL